MSNNGDGVQTPPHYGRQTKASIAKSAATYEKKTRNASANTSGSPLNMLVYSPTVREKKAIREKDRQLKEANEQLSTAEHHIWNLRQDYNKAQEKWQSQRSELEAKLLELRQELMACDLHTKEIDRLTTKVTALTAELAVSNNQVSECQSKIAELRVNITKIRFDHAVDLDELLAKNADLVKENRQLKGLLDENQQKLLAVADVSRRFETAAGAVHHLQSELATSQGELQEMRQLHREQLAQKEEEYGCLLIDLETARAEAIKAKAEAAELLQIQQNMSTSHNEQLANKESEYCSQLRDLQLQLVAERAKLAEAKLSFQRQHEELKLLRTRPTLEDQYSQTDGIQAVEYNQKQLVFHHQLYSSDHNNNEDDVLQANQLETHSIVESVRPTPVKRPNNATSQSPSSASSSSTLGSNAMTLMDEERAQELLRRNKMVSAAFQSSYAIETNSVPILHEDAVKGRLLDPLPLFSPITVLSPIAIPNKKAKRDGAFRSPFAKIRNISNKENAAKNMTPSTGRRTPKKSEKMFIDMSSSASSASSAAPSMPPKLKERLLSRFKPSNRHANA